MALRANSTELFFIFVANEEDAISDFYGILSVGASCEISIADFP